MMIGHARIIRRGTALAVAVAASAIIAVYFVARALGLGEDAPTAGQGEPLALTINVGAMWERSAKAVKLTREPTSSGIRRRWQLGADRDDRTLLSFERSWREGVEVADRGWYRAVRDFSAGPNPAR